MKTCCGGLWANWDYEAEELFFLSIILMGRAAEPRPVSLDRVEEQHEVGAIHTRMSHHRNRVDMLVRSRSPPTVLHYADSRGFNSPCSHRGTIRRASPDSDDDAAVGVLPVVLFRDSAIRNVLAHVEHRPGMVASAGATATAIPTATAKA